jgi:photosystem II stability/assembly factor-like uncharacterized protein
MKILRSDDLGRTFREAPAPAFAKDDGRALANIWALEAGTGKREIWCGVEPAALFHSDDGGETWEKVDGISDHPTRTKWNPGAGGLCLHTIIVDGRRVHVAISAAGHYLSEDGGRTFAPANRGVGAGFLPEAYPEVGQCVHKIAQAAAPGRFYMQNHGGWAEWEGPGGKRPEIGILRSDDHGKTWRSIAKGLPSDFGFPVVAHPTDAETAWVMPLAPATRTCPDGAPAVWRTDDGGASWERQAKGLPKKETFFTVLRDGMTIDRLTSPALYFGTTTGQVWIGRDGGERWERIFDSLPPVNCVKVATV